MSWTQGIQAREHLPEAFVKWADGLGKGALEYITWDDTDRRTLFLDYGERGAFKAVFKQDAVS